MTQGYIKEICNIIERVIRRDRMTCGNALRGKSGVRLLSIVILSRFSALRPLAAEPRILQRQRSALL
eukprot:9269303-Lingulodinium_polyedra.AAC.1